MVVKANMEESEDFYLTDVGVIGNPIVKLNNGEATFSGNKFVSTSYMNEGIKFHLLIFIRLNEDLNEENPKILNASISPPMFVDSRRKAREENNQFLLVFKFLIKLCFFLPFKKRKKKHNMSNHSNRIY